MLKKGSPYVIIDALVSIVDDPESKTIIMESNT